MQGDYSGGHTHADNYYTRMNEICMKNMFIYKVIWL